MQYQGNTVLICTHVPLGKYTVPVMKNSRHRLIIVTSKRIAYIPIKGYCTSLSSSAEKFGAQRPFACEIATTTACFRLICPGRPGKRTLRYLECVRVTEVRSSFLGSRRKGIAICDPILWVCPQAGTSIQSEQDVQRHSQVALFRHRRSQIAGRCVVALVLFIPH